MGSRGFRDLAAYQLAYGAAVDVFRLTKSFPRDERFELTAQMRRSSRAVPVLVAEGYRRRRYPNAFVNKIGEADTEATETQVWLDLSHSFEYLAADRHAKLIATYEEIGRILNGMMDNPSAFFPH